MNYYSAKKRIGGLFRRFGDALKKRTGPKNFKKVLWGGVAGIVTTVTIVTAALVPMFHNGVQAQTVTGEFWYDYNSRPISSNPYGWNKWLVEVWIDFGDGLQAFWAYAECQQAAFMEPATGWKTVDFTLTKQSNGQTYVEGYVPGSAGRQDLLVYFTVDLRTPYQPVATSLAPIDGSSGDVLTDRLTIFEADQDGNKVTGSSNWPRTGGGSGDYISANICVDIYGPYYSNQTRNPALLNDGKFFSASDYTPAPVPDGSNITFIGDSYTNTSVVRDAISALSISGLHRLQGMTFYTTSRFYDSSTISLIQNPSTVIKDYVIYALGTNSGWLDATNTNFQAIVDAIRARNPNAKIVFMTIFDGTLPINAKDPLSTPVDNININIRTFNQFINGRVLQGTFSDFTTTLPWFGFPSSNSSFVEADGKTPTLTGAAEFARALYESVSKLMPGSESSFGGQGQYGVGDAGNPAAGQKWMGRKCMNTGNRPSAPGETGWTLDFIFDNLDSVATGVSNDSRNWPAGKYYFVAHVSKANNPEVLLDNWYSPFAEATETTGTKVNFGTTSAVSADYVDPSNPAGFNDVLTISIYKASSTINEGPGNKVSRYVYSNRLPLSNWPQNDSGYLPVNVCVTAYGPYQSPQNRPATLTGKFLQNGNYASEPKPTNNTVCNNMSPGINSGTTSFNFSSYAAGWLPGHYYFVSSINIASQSVEMQSFIADESWVSRFNPADENEQATIKFQPIAKSIMSGATVGGSGYNGVVIDCTASPNPSTVTAGSSSSVQNSVPPEKLTCSNVVDKVYITATTSQDFNSMTRVYTDTHQNPNHWLRDGGGYIPVNFQVKLYGPFATPPSPKDPASPGIGKDTPLPTGLPWISPTTQPIAASDIITASNGPKWGTVNRNCVNSTECYHATLKQNSAGNGNVALGALNTTDLKLAPGFYVSVIEILKTPMNSSISSLLLRDFYSAWADPYESMSVRQPVYVWSNVGASADMRVEVGSKIKDTIHIVGSTNQAKLPCDASDPNCGGLDWGTRTDALGNNYTSVHGNFAGTSGYFPADTNAKVNIRLLYHEDSTSLLALACQAGTATVVWQQQVALRDYINRGSLSPITTPDYRVEQRGWYLYHISYDGSDARIAPFSSGCNDGWERVYARGILAEPKLSTVIQPVKPKAPTVIHDTVTVIDDGDTVLPDSIVNLTLYKRIGSSNNFATDTKICSVEFTVSGFGVYSTTTYLESDGTVKPAFSPSGAPSPNRCFAARFGHYYWVEDFLLPGGEFHYNLYPIDRVSDGEEITLEETKPTVITKADPTVRVGHPFKDTAIVTIPAGTDRTYELYFTAYGPQKADGSAPICNAENVLFTSSVIKNITQSGEYVSNTTVAQTPGNIYWIETIRDQDDPEWTFSGECGKEGEITRITEDDPPPPPPAGVIARNAVVVLAIGGLLAIAIWQLMKRRPELFRQTRK